MSCEIKPYSSRNCLSIKLFANFILNVKASLLVTVQKSKWSWCIGVIIYSERTKSSDYRGGECIPIQSLITGEGGRKFIRVDQSL